MAIQIQGTTVIDDSRNLANIANLKTINNTSILGTGDIAISGSSGGGTNDAMYENDTFITNDWEVGSGVLSACTISIASPAVITQANTFIAGQPIRFTTTGALPTGLTTTSVYYVISTGLTTSSYQVSLTRGGAAVNTSGTQSGTHKAGKLRNAQSAGAIEIANGVTVTVPSGATWTIV